MISLQMRLCIQYPMNFDLSFTVGPPESNQETLIYHLNSSHIITCPINTTTMRLAMPR